MLLNTELQQAFNIKMRRAERLTQLNTSFSVMGLFFCLTLLLVQKTWVNVKTKSPDFA